ncbi:MAG: hypothetical protein JXA71_12265 [Chitinispirillaceae bacterium]|nr:hypothetical protein [Chitinispirillaceae bacterium]
MDRRDLFRAGAGIGTMVLLRPVYALQAVTAARKNWAIVYGTQCGSSLDAATWINAALGGIADILEVSTGPKPAEYEHFIIGGPIQAGQLITPVKNFVTCNQAALKSKIQGLFTLCGNSGSTTLRDTTIKSYLTDQIVQLSGVTDKPAKLFLGRSTPACGGMTYDNLKRADCEAFGRAILDTAVKETGKTASRSFELRQNRPDPFNPVTTISYGIPRSGRVKLTVCTLHGQLLATLVSGYQEAGIHEIVWDGSALAPGCYLYRLNAEGFSATRTMRRAGR